MWTSADHGQRASWTRAVLCWYEAPEAQGHTEADLNLCNAFANFYIAPVIRLQAECRPLPKSRRELLGELVGAMNQGR